MMISLVNTVVFQGSLTGRVRLVVAEVVELRIILVIFVLVVLITLDNTGAHSSLFILVFLKITVSFLPVGGV